MENLKRRLAERDAFRETLVRVAEAAEARQAQRIAEANAKPTFKSPSELNERERKTFAAKALAAGFPQEYVEAMLAHATDYLELFATVVIAWQWLELAAAARERDAREAAGPFTAGLRAAAQHWIATDLPRIDHLAHLCTSGEDSYLRLSPDEL